MITYEKDDVVSITDKKTHEIKIKKLDDRAVIPSKAHPGDIGYDITAISCEYDENHDMYIYHTGLAIESEQGVGNLLFVRSSNCKTDAYLANHVGLVDSATYRGEIQLRYKNRTSLKSRIDSSSLSRTLISYNPLKAIISKIKGYFGMDDNYTVTTLMDNLREVKEAHIVMAKQLEFAPYKVGDRIGQMVFMDFPNIEFKVVDELSETDRNDGGFGSSGK